MSKKFIEFLNEADKNEVLYVGTKKNGTCWIIIESVDIILKILIV